MSCARAAHLDDGLTQLRPFKPSRWREPMVLRTSLALLTLAMALAPAARADSVRPSAEPSRTRGAAPLAVFFDATATRCDGDCNAFLDLHYAWDFGDPGSGTWAVRGNSRNAAYGPTAAHVFEKAGTYT